MSDTNALPTSPSRLPRNALLAGGGIALVGLGLAAGLMLRSPGSSTSGQAPLAPTAAAPADTGTPGANASSSAQLPPPVAVAPQNAPHHTADHRAPTVVANQAPQQQPYALPSRNVDEQPAVAVCATCGVIESVRPVQQKGQGTGLGAVAGGVLGGVVGNSMGGGSGKTALTVLGAIGGGVAGNEVEKRARGSTVYEVRVRMDDGSIRTFTQHSAPAAGARVTVEGHTFRTIGNGNANTGEPRVMQTSGQGPA